jgi:hypothetical protein
VNNFIPPAPFCFLFVSEFANFLIVLLWRQLAGVVVGHNPAKFILRTCALEISDPGSVVHLFVPLMHLISSQLPRICQILDLHVTCRLRTSTLLFTCPSLESG